jgi:DNA-binding NarL/FixJ family response regulator
MTESVKNISVFLVTENRLLRESLTRLLNTRSDINVVGFATCSLVTSEAIAACAPDVLLFDPKDVMSEIVFLRELKEVQPRLKVVMIGRKPDRELFFTAVREGVVGYLLMNATGSEVVAAVRSVVEGQAVCPPELCRLLFDYAQNQTYPPGFPMNQRFRLTRREQQLVVLIGQGLTNKEIARELFLSEQTVKNQVHKILRKTGVNDRLAAVEACRTLVVPPAYSLQGPSSVLGNGME